MFERILCLIEILRPHNMLAASLGVVAGYHVAGGREPGGVALCALLTALATGAGNVINDYYDVAVDRVNKPSRPIPSGRVSPRAALWVYAAVTLVATLAAGARLQREAAAVIVGWEAALFVYARVCKRVLVVGNLLVAGIAASSFLLGGLAAGDARAATVPCAIAFVFVLCRELVKGGEDFDGDARAGVRTLAVALGRERAARAAAILMLAVAVALPLPAVAGLYHPPYLIVMATLVGPVLVAGAAAITRSPHKRTFGRVSRALKLAMFAGIAAIVLGA